MVSGKDDLVKLSSCGVNGTYRLNELGFDDQRRCAGKGDVFGSWTQPTDPYGVYLTQHFYPNGEGQNDSDWNISYVCDTETCCTSDGHQRTCPVAWPLPDESYQDNWVTRNTKQMLQAVQGIPEGTPWFVQINWAGPHAPFVITRAMNESVKNRSYPYQMNSTQNANDALIARRDYAAEIENLDLAFGDIISALRDLDEFENTIVCVSSDHGEMLGDFGHFRKEKPWVASTNVPFVCMGPGIRKNEVIETYVTNMDIAGTVLDFAEIEALAEMTTVSLRPFLNGSWTDERNEYRAFISSGLSQKDNLWRKDILPVAWWALSGVARSNMFKSSVLAELGWSGLLRRKWLLLTFCEWAWL